MAAALFMLQRLCGCAELRHWGALFLLSAELTFNLLFRASGMTGGAWHAHIVPVDVLEKHLSVPAGQSARLEHSDMMFMRATSQRVTTTNKKTRFWCLNVLA